MDKKKLAKTAQKKREQIILDFYNEKKGRFEESAAKGYTGLSVPYDELTEEQKLAFRREEERLSEIIKDVDASLETEKMLVTGWKYYSKVTFSWG